MSESLSLPKVKLISPEKRKLYYEKILSETPINGTETKNKIKNIQVKKNRNTSSNKTNDNTDNMQTIEAICNIIDLINDNNLNIFYKEDSSSNFKRNIDQLNLKFYLETEKIISSNQNKTKEDNTSFNSNKLFLILFKQINLYIKEIERLNSLIINSVKDADNMKKKMAIFIRKQNDFETKEQIIRALKFSVNSLEQKLSNVLISENNLRQEIQRLKKENNYYYDFYKSSKSSNNNNYNNNTYNNNTYNNKHYNNNNFSNYNINTHSTLNNKRNPFNKSQTINDLKQNLKNQHLKHKTKDNFFNKSKEIILLNDSRNNNLLGNDHKRNNSENDNHSNNMNNNELSGSLQKYYNVSPKRKKKTTINIKDNDENNNNNNNPNGPKSIIRLCNYYSHNIEIDLPLGFKSKSPGKNFYANKIKDINLGKQRKSGREKNLFPKTNNTNENKLDVNIVNNNNNTFIFENSFIQRNKTIYNTINPSKDISINRLFKNRTNSDKCNDEEKSKNNKTNSTSVNKELKMKKIENDIENLNELETLLIDIKDYIINNETKRNKSNSNSKKKKENSKNISKNKDNLIHKNSNGKKINNVK